MLLRRARWRIDRATGLSISGGALSVGVAAITYSLFSINGLLTRDASIYAYGGQQLSRGVAPYVSIFDAKSPGATLTAGLGAEIARLGVDDVYAIRIVFFLCALATVLGV